MDLIEIDDLPMNSMVMFHSYVNVYQRVTNSMIFLGSKVPLNEHRYPDKWDGFHKR